MSALQKDIDILSHLPIKDFPGTLGARRAYPDREWSRRSSSLAIRRQEGVSGPRVVQPFLFTRYPPPGRRLRIPGGPAVHLQSLSAARKASPGSRVVQPSISLAIRRQECVSGPRVSSRSSLLAIRRQEGVSGPRVVQAFIFTCYTPPGRRFRTATGPGVYRYSLSAARKAYPDRDRSRRLSSLVIRHQEGVSGSRVVQAFTLTRYPPPGRRIGTPSGPGVHLHSLSAARKAYPDPEWSRRSSALAIRLQKGVSGPRVVQPFIFTHCPPPGRRFQAATGPAVHLHSLSAARKAHPDPEWSSRSSSLAIRCQEGVSGPRLVQVIIFTRYPPPGSRTRTPSGPTVHLHSLSAARKAYPDPEWSRRSSALATRLQKGVSGPRVVQPFIFTRSPLPGMRIETPDGPAVHLHSLSATGKAYPDRGWSYRSSSLAIRRQECAPRPRVVQPFFFTRYPLPGRRIRTATGPGDYLHSLSAARKAYPDPEWSRRSSALATRLQKGVSGPRMVQPFIFTRSPLPGMRIETPDGPAVHLHSLSATGKAYPDRDWSYRSSSLAIRSQECAPRPRVVQPFFFTRYPLPGRRIRTATGPGDYLHSLSAAKKSHPDPEWSSRSSSLAIRHQEGVSGPRVVQAFIRTRYPPPERRIGTPSGPVVHLHSLSAARKACPDPGWSSRSSSLAVRLQEGVSGPRVVQPFIFTRYPPPGRRIRTAGGPAVHLHSLSAARKAYPDPEWSRRSSSPAFRCQEGVSRPRAVQPFILTRYPLPGRRLRTPSGPAVHLRSLSAARKAYRDPECPSVHFYSLFAARKAYRDPQWSIRSSSVAIRRQEGGSGPRLVQAFIFARLSASRKAYTVPRGQPFFLTRLSAVRRTHADRGWSSRSRQLAYLPPGSRFRFAHAFSRSS